MFDFSFYSMGENLSKSTGITNALPEGMAEGIANEILNAMPADNADVAQFVSVAMREIAKKLETESEKLSVKIPSAEELIAYAGEYNFSGNMTWAMPNLKDIIKKLINSRYDLSDFADIRFSEENKNEAETIIIAAGYKGKLLYISISKHDDGFEQILKKCTMH